MDLCEPRELSHQESAGKQGIDMTKTRFLPLIGISIFLYLLYRIGIGEIGRSLAHCDLKLICLAIPVFVPAVFLKTYRWRLLLGKQKIRLSFSSLLKFALIGEFYGFVTPGKLGSFFRVYLLKQKVDRRVGECTVSVLVDRILDIFALVLFAIIGSVLLIGRTPMFLIAVSSFLLSLFLLFGVIIGKRRSRYAFTKIINSLIPGKLMGKLKPEIDSFYSNLPRMSILLWPYFLSLVIWFLLYTQLYIVAIALNVKMPFFYFTSILPISQIIGLIPITVSGLGTRDATFVFLLSLFGVTAEKAFSLSLLGYVVVAGLPAFYGWISALEHSIVSKIGNDRHFAANNLRGEGITWSKVKKL